MLISGLNNWARFSDNYLLANAFQDAGLDGRTFGCWDGGVRMYLPGFSVGSDPHKHSLWVRSFLEGKGPSERIKLISRRVAAHSVGLRVPAGFVRTIEDHDLKIAAEQSARVAVSGVLGEQVEALQAHIWRLQEQEDHFRREADQVPYLRKEILEKEDLIQTMEQDAALLRDEKENQQKRAGKLQAQLDQQEASRKESPAPVDQGLQELFDGLLLPQPAWTPLGAYVRLLQARFPDRVVFLPEALSSADDCTFEQDAKAKSFLLKLVTDYFDALVEGENGDQSATQFFGKDGFASKEAENLSPDGVRARTFAYEGEDVRMETHLKITKGFERNSSNRVFRTHFCWDAPRKRLVVGHVGRHLPP